VLITARSCARYEARGARSNDDGGGGGGGGAGAESAPRRAESTYTIGVVRHCLHRATGSRRAASRRVASRHVTANGPVNRSRRAVTYVRLARF